MTPFTCFRPLPTFHWKGFCRHARHACIFRFHCSHYYRNAPRIVAAIGQATPRFLQGVYPFAGRGVYELAPLHDELTYIVPAAQYGANRVLSRRQSCRRPDLSHRFPPTVPPSAISLSVPKPICMCRLPLWRVIPSGTRLQICFAAPRGLTGTVIVDVGIVEMAADADAEGN